MSHVFDVGRNTLRYTSTTWYRWLSWAKCPEFGRHMTPEVLLDIAE